jgi:glutathione synthase/RimK-type ligase-like ATP-grasp enzyme
MKIALLTCQHWPGLIEKEQALAQKINPEFDVDVVVWNDPAIVWTTYYCLIFRTIWDYFEQPIAFNLWLDKIEKLGIKTLNPIDVIRKNQHKFYLKNLKNQGIEIIPTVFIPKNSVLNLEIINQKKWQKAVIKPAVSGGSYLTKLFDANDIATVEAEYSNIVAERDLLLQPFMPEIQTHGEISLLFYGGQYSHAILKTPQNEDFRVQSQFGGQYQSYQPTAALIDLANKIIELFDNQLLYARVDGILSNGQFLLMEVELIEPDLFFDYHPEAQKRYLTALETMAIGQ